MNIVSMATPLPVMLRKHKNSGLVNI